MVMPGTQGPRTQGPEWPQQGHVPSQLDDGTIKNQGQMAGTRQVTTVKQQGIIARILSVFRPHAKPNPSVIEGAMADKTVMPARKEGFFLRLVHAIFGGGKSSSSSDSIVITAERKQKNVSFDDEVSEATPAEPVLSEKVMRFQEVDRKLGEGKSITSEEKKLYDEGTTKGWSASLKAMMDYALKTDRDLSNMFSSLYEKQEGIKAFTEVRDSFKNWSLKSSEDQDEIVHRWMTKYPAVFTDVNKAKLYGAALDVGWIDDKWFQMGWEKMPPESKAGEVHVRLVAVHDVLKGQRRMTPDKAKELFSGWEIKTPEARRAIYDKLVNDAPRQRLELTFEDIDLYARAISEVTKPMHGGATRVSTPQEAEDNLQKKLIIESYDKVMKEELTPGFVQKLFEDWGFKEMVERHAIHQQVEKAGIQISYADLDLYANAVSEGKVDTGVREATRRNIEWISLNDKEAANILPLIHFVMRKKLSDEQIKQLFQGWDTKNMDEVQRVYQKLNELGVQLNIEHVELYAKAIAEGVSPTGVVAARVTTPTAMLQTTEQQEQRLSLIREVIEKNVKPGDMVGLFANWDKKNEAAKDEVYRYLIRTKDEGGKDLSLSREDIDFFAADFSAPRFTGLARPPKEVHAAIQGMSGAGELAIGIIETVLRLPAAKLSDEEWSGIQVLFFGTGLTRKDLDAYITDRRAHPEKYNS